MDYNPLRDMVFGLVKNLVEEGMIIVWDRGSRRLLSHPDVWCSINGGALQINFFPEEDQNHRRQKLPNLDNELPL